MPVAWFLGAGRSGGSGAGDFLGGADLLQLLVLAFGGALVVGNGLALLGPRSDRRNREGSLERPAVGRSLVMMGVGLIAAIWAIATLLS